jgi:hypothetical protein
LNNGTCMNETCLCAEGYTGFGCSQCADHYYGMNCSKTPLLFRVEPNSITDLEARDGVNITVIGDNFNFATVTNVHCGFQGSYNWTVPATEANDSTIICPISNYTSWTAIALFVSLDSGASWFGNIYGYSLYIGIRLDCGNNICYFGFCSYGQCNCSVGYTGPSCDQCAVGYFRWTSNSCVKCSDYCLNNGTCMNETCLCAEGYTGFGCSQCADHYYGMNCSNAPVLFRVEPNSITDLEARDGINITVIGDNFNLGNISAIVCGFQGSYNWTVPAVAGNSSSVICHVINYTDDTAILIAVSFDNGENWLKEAYYGSVLSIIVSIVVANSCQKHASGRL